MYSKGLAAPSGAGPGQRFRIARLGAPGRVALCLGPRPGSGTGPRTIRIMGRSRFKFSSTLANLYVRRRRGLLAPHASHPAPLCQIPCHCEDWVDLLLTTSLERAPICS